MIGRRGFVGGMLAGLMGAAGAAPQVVERVTEAAESCPRVDGDLGRLTWILDTYPADVVAAGMIAEMAGGSPLDIQSLWRRLNRERRRERRHSERAARRERHAGNETLYHGPLAIRQAFDGREVRSAARRRVLVGETDREYVIDGIGVPMIERPAATYERDDDGVTLIPCEARRARSLTIPAGSRVLIDLRHGLRDVMACEVVCTRDGRVRLHLWTGRDGRLEDETTPTLRGGVAWSGVSSMATQRLGLLGLPLGDEVAP